MQEQPPIEHTEVTKIHVLNESAISEITPVERVRGISTSPDPGSGPGGILSPEATAEPLPSDQRGSSELASEKIKDYVEGTGITTSFLIWPGLY